MTCSAAIKAYYKYTCYWWSIVISRSLTHSTIWVHPFKKQPLWPVAHTVCDRLMNWNDVAPEVALLLVILLPLARLCLNSLKWQRGVRCKPQQEEPDLHMCISYTTLCIRYKSLTPAALYCVCSSWQESGHFTSTVCALEGAVFCSFILFTDGDMILHYQLAVSPSHS